MRNKKNFQKIIMVLFLINHTLVGQNLTLRETPYNIYSFAQLCKGKLYTISFYEHCVVSQ